METIAREAFSLKVKIKELTEQHDNLMNRLKIDSQGETKTYGKYRLTFSIRPGVVEYSRIPVLKGIDLTPYRKEAVAVSKLEFLGE